MDYLSWFKKTEANVLVLKEYIKKKNPEIQEVRIDNIRLILIIDNIEEDRLLNACYSIENQVQIWGFKLLKEMESITIVPFKILDNQEITPISTKINLTEEQILSHFSNWKELYKIVKEYVKSLGENIESYPVYDNEIAFKGDRVFLRIRFRKKKGLMLDMGEVKGIEDPRFKYWKDINWGYVYITSKEELDEAVKEWVKKAYLSG